jgi:hypothetical protein
MWKKKTVTVTFTINASVNGHYMIVFGINLSFIWFVGGNPGVILIKKFCEIGKAGSKKIK